MFQYFKHFMELGMFQCFKVIVEDMLGLPQWTIMPFIMIA